MTKENVEWWDLVLRQDLQFRISNLDSKWERSNLLVRNTGEGKREGNLVEDYIRVLQVRLFAQPFELNITAFNPDYVHAAEETTVVAEAIYRIAGLEDGMFEAVKDAQWATTGWLEVGHPMDPWSLDIMRSIISPNTEEQQGGTGSDEWVEVDPSSVPDPENVVPFDPFSELPSPDGPEEPQPLFRPEGGYPWMSVVDPRLVLIPPLARKREGLDYICRLRFVTRRELQLLRGVDYGTASGSLGEFRDLFRAVEGKDPVLYPDMMLLMETWIIRDRNNPEFNNWYLCHVQGHPEWVIANRVNPYGGMVPLTPVKPLKHKAYYDSSPAETLSKFADIFDVGIKSLYRRFLRTLNEKWLEGNNSGLDVAERGKLNNDNYRGNIKVTDPTQVVKLKEEGIDQAFLFFLNYVKGLAQTTNGASDIDRGVPIKSISARQTSALLQATGINIEGMKSEIGNAAREVMMKLMHLVALFNHQTQGMKYQGTKKMVVMDRGYHDFTQSYIYRVEVFDSGETEAEEQLAWNQFLRTLMTDQGGVILPYFDREELARRTVRKFGQDPGLLASRGANRPGTGLMASADPQVQAGFLGGGQISPGAPGPAGVSDMADGQHPERLPGSRGLSMSNLLTGLKRTGT